MTEIKLQNIKDTKELAFYCLRNLEANRVYNSNHYHQIDFGTKGFGIILYYYDTEPQRLSVKANICCKDDFEKYLSEVVNLTDEESIEFKYAVNYFKTRILDRILKEFKKSNDASN